MITEFKSDKKDIRIDAYIAEMIPELSRSYASDLISQGLVLMDGNTVKSSNKVRIGALISVDIPEPVVTDTQPENIPLDIVYEDKDLLVINKPQESVGIFCFFKDALFDHLVHRSRGQ